jgi:MFS family permease
MGTSFRWLIGSSWVSNLGDGIGVAAGPLLIASQTQDPLLVALGALLGKLPWLLFGLYAGVLADRIDRRAMVVAVDLMRAVVLAVLAMAILGDQVSIALVLVAMLLLGTAEVFADTGAGTLLPMVIAKEDLGIGNARLMAGELTTNALVGPAVGAVLFAAGTAIPFVTQAVCVALGALLVSRCAFRRWSGGPRRRTSAATSSRACSWTWHNAAVRTLTLTIVTFNVTYGAAWSVLVLYATQRLGLGAVGFGLLTSFVAAGGIFGTASYDWLERHASLADIMRVGLVIETFTHLGLALTTTGWVAMAIMFVFGAHAFVWGNHVARRAHARGADGAPGPRRQPVLDRRVRRHPRRPGRRRRHRPPLGPHGAVLVRVLRLGDPARADLAGARPHRPRGRAEPA